MQANKQQEIEKKHKKQYLSNSKQVNADAVAHNQAYTSQIAYMPLLTIGLSNFA